MGFSCNFTVLLNIFLDALFVNLSLRSHLVVLLVANELLKCSLLGRGVPSDDVLRAQLARRSHQLRLEGGVFFQLSLLSGLFLEHGSVYFVHLSSLELSLLFDEVVGLFLAKHTHLRFFFLRTALRRSIA